MRTLPDIPRTIDLSDVKIESSTPLSLISDSVQIVALETTELNPIGDVSKIIVNKKRIYILDRNKSSCIFVFSQDGKFLGKIGQKGHGSQEYIEPTDFDISGENVLVLDQFKSKLISYSPDGRYISSKDMPFFATGLSVMNDSTYLFNSVDADNTHLGDCINYAMLMTDSALIIKKKGFISTLRSLWRNCRPLGLSLLSLIIFSLFSYPFELLPFQIIAVIMAACAPAYRDSAECVATKKHLRAKLSITLTAIMMLVIPLSCLSNYQISMRKDAESSYSMIAGNNNVAFTDDYHQLLPLLHDNKRFLFDYARLLSAQKRYNDSNDLLRKGALISNDPMFTVLQGNNFRDMGAIHEAEEAYFKAHHMMPNRLYPLYRLMCLYNESDDTAKRDDMARRILDFKEKISSPATDYMKKKAQQILSTSYGTRL